jgi:hypothetical protein
MAFEVGSMEVLSGVCAAKMANMVYLMREVKYEEDAQAYESQKKLTIPVTILLGIWMRKKIMGGGYRRPLHTIMNFLIMSKPVKPRTQRTYVIDLLNLEGVDTNRCTVAEGRAFMDAIWPQWRMEDLIKAAFEMSVKIAMERTLMAAPMLLTALKYNVEFRDRMGKRKRDS